MTTAEINRREIDDQINQLCAALALCCQGMNDEDDRGELIDEIDRLNRLLA